MIKSTHTHSLCPHVRNTVCYYGDRQFTQCHCDWCLIKFKLSIDKRRGRGCLFSLFLPCLFNANWITSGLISRNLSVSYPALFPNSSLMTCLTIQPVVIGSRGDFLHFLLRPHRGPAAILLELDLITVHAAVEDLNKKPANKHTRHAQTHPRNCTQTHTNIVIFYTEAEWPSTWVGF